MKTFIENHKALIMTIAFGVLAVVLRILPHPPNVAAVGALGLFGGTYLKSRWSILVPVPIMLVSDFFIGFYNWKVMVVVYGGFIAMALLGRFLRDRVTVHAVLGTALLGSLIFYLTTNFAVWATSPWYTKDITGLLISYTLALPFFRNSLIGDLFFSGVFFGLYALIANGILWHYAKDAVFKFKPSPRFVFQRGNEDISQ